VSQILQRERTFGRCLDRIEKDAPPPGKRVLDVGAAGGSFLAEARKRGYLPFGVEPSQWMCRFAREHYGLDLEPGTIFDVAREPGSLDLLSLWDVLEHTTDPTAVLKRAHELLAPGGTLAISVPDYGSLAARAMGVATGSHWLKSPTTVTCDALGAVRTNCTRRSSRVVETLAMPGGRFGVAARGSSRP